MDLSQLPSEMVEAIANHLEARDVTACSGVSRAWRQAFNLDRIWKRFCSFSLDFFPDENNKVKPSFQIPFVEGADLDPLCNWRVNFLKESYVAKNWQKVCFSSEEVETQTNVCLYMKDGLDADGNHWMFLVCSSREGMKLEIWSLKNLPCLQVSMKICDVEKNINEADDGVNFTIHLCGQKLVFIVNGLISVYDFSPPHYKINFVYTFSVIHSHPFFVPRRLPHLPTGTICEVEVIGRRLFAATYRPTGVLQQFSPSIHVWDIEKMAKIKDHCVLEPKEDAFETVRSLSLTHGMSDNLVITITLERLVLGAEKTSKVRTFNMRKNNYSNFYVKTKSRVIWSVVAGDILVFCELISSLQRDCVFHFYNILSHQCFLKTSTYNIYDPEKITSSGSKFAFIDLNSEVTVFDILTQQKFTSRLQPSRNRLKTLTLVNDQLLLLENKYKGTSRSFDDILITSYEIWNFLQKPKPIRLDYCFRSMTRSKFTFVKNIRVPPKLLTLVQPLYRPATICVNSFW